jgi:hypothetical protein
MHKVSIGPFSMEHPNERNSPTVSATQDLWISKDTSMAPAGTLLLYNPRVYKSAEILKSGD